ncbi:MAG: chromosome segregation protein [Planctomycetaceae bacterium]|nr:chromosome segregation protein [Planctomycetaceae bacterium]
MRPAVLVGLAFTICNWADITTASAVEPVNFNRDIRPLLSDRCFQCHGPNKASRQARLRFDTALTGEGLGEDRGGHRVVRPGDVEGSELWRRVTTDDPEEAMPPRESHKPRLNAKERELVRRWILEGAKYDEFWAFVAPRAIVQPQVNAANWSSQRIDQFVLSRLEREGWQPQPRAERRTLLRRVTLDLTGLPPTRQEIAAFLEDGTEEAYEHVVDRLLGEMQYGEHMARYWLDLVRFADTNGIHHDHFREITPYRDWVIRAFNDNLRFDHFIHHQVAGDLYENATLDQQIASGFNRLHLVIDAGTALPAESFARNVIDRVTAFGTAFLGLTLQCAVCHDHKYDPITQRDFYQLYAFFNNIDARPETPGSGVHAPFVRVPTAEQALKLKGLEAAGDAIDAAAATLQKVSADLGGVAGDNLAASEAVTAVKSALTATQSASKKNREQIVALQKQVTTTLVMRERSEVRPTHILVRGAYDRPGERVFRATPAFLPELSKKAGTPTRMDLAHWLTDGKNPLTARVAVNRFWQQLFGVGLVKTSEDFGAQGEWPSHPELLDDLATRFVMSDWNVKQLLREILLSETYRQSAAAGEKAYQTDPDNRLLGRGSRFRLDAETVRDQILFVSGLLNPRMYGQSVKPPQPPNLWKSVSMVSSSTYAFKADEGDKIFRRSLYSFWKRAMPPPQMTIFDAPTRERCIARRERTNTPLQALVLMNEAEYFRAARVFAKRILEYPDEETRLRVAYEQVTSLLPDDGELEVLRNGLAAFRKIYQEDPLAVAVLEKGDALSPAEEQQERGSVDSAQIEFAAYSMLMHSLLNLDITKTRQ